MHDLGKYAKKSHIAIQTRYVSFLAVGSVAMVGLVFALGVLVGSRHVEAPVCPAPDPLAQLDLKSNAPLPADQASNLRLSYHEALLAKMDTVPVPASLVKRGAIESANGAKDGPRAQPVVADAQPRHHEAPIPEAVPHDEPGVYSLQVGSFDDRTDAAKMVAELSRAGHTSFLVRVNMPDEDKSWFRVRVGPFQSKKEAWAYKKQFEERERLPAFVVKRRVKG